MSDICHIIVRFQVEEVFKPVGMNIKISPFRRARCKEMGGDSWWLQFSILLPHSSINNPGILLPNKFEGLFCNGTLCVCTRGGGGRREKWKTVSAKKGMHATGFCDVVGCQPRGCAFYIITRTDGIKQKNKNKWKTLVKFNVKW